MTDPTIRELLDSMPESDLFRQSPVAEWYKNNRDSLRTALLLAERAGKSEALLRECKYLFDRLGYDRIIAKIDAHFAGGENS